MMAAIGLALVAVGVASSALGVLGLFRMPDVYTRMHAVAKVVTLGAASCLIGLALLSEAAIGVRAVAIMLFLYLTTPIATHATARAAHRRGEPMAPSTRLDELAARSPDEPT